MEVIYNRCAGLDAHKKTITACRVHTKANGRKVQETATFGTTTAELLRLLEWLLAWSCTHVVMESTGVYWKPVYPGQDRQHPGRPCGDPAGQCSARKASTRPQDRHQ